MLSTGKGDKIETMINLNMNNMNEFYSKLNTA